MALSSQQGCFQSINKSIFVYYMVVRPQYIVKNDGRHDIGLSQSASAISLE